MGVKKTHQQFLDEISDKGIQVEVLEEYINSQTPLSCKCKKCGLIWKIRPNNLLRGYGCPSCAGQYRRTSDEFVRDLNAVNPNIELLGRYQGDKEKTLCLCKICGHEWNSDYEHLVRRKQGCPNCNSSKKAVINLTTGKIYESASAAARHLGVSINAVGMVCRGKAKTCKGDQWCYVENLSDEEKRHYNLLKT